MRALALAALLTPVGCGQRSVPLDPVYRPLERVVEASWVQEGMVTTIAPNVFVRSVSDFFSWDQPMLHVILMHERVHAIREIEAGSHYYVDYASFPSFRWEEEKLAYAEQFRLMKRAQLPIDAHYYAEMMSTKYARMVTYDVALAWILKETGQ